MATLYRIFLLSVLLVLIGCTPRSTLSIQLKAQPELNTAVSGESLPVMVRLYQLSSIEPFQQANFHGLWKKESQVLGDSLIQKKEIQISPDEQKSIKWKQQDLAHYLGVMAIFRDPKGHHKTQTSIHQRIPGWPSQHQLVLSGHDVRFDHE